MRGVVCRLLALFGIRFIAEDRVLLFKHQLVSHQELVLLLGLLLVYTIFWLHLYRL